MLQKYKVISITLSLQFNAEFKHSVSICLSVGTVSLGGLCCVVFSWNRCQEKINLSFLGLSSVLYQLSFEACAQLFPVPEEATPKTAAAALRRQKNELVLLTGSSRFRASQGCAGEGGAFCFLSKTNTQM